MPLLTLRSATVVNGSSTTVSCEPGDFIFVWAWRRDGSTSPSLPSGWQNTGNRAGTAVAERCGWRRAHTTSQSIPSWGGANCLVVCVFDNAMRGNTIGTGISAVRNNVGHTAASTSFYWPGVTGNKDGFSFWLGFAAINQTDTNINSFIPAGGTLIANADGSNYEAMAWMSSQPFTTDFTQSNHTLTGTSGEFLCRIMEIRSQPLRVLKVT